MPSVQTPATIVAAASALIPMVGALNATGDPAKQAQAAALQAQIQATLAKAAKLAAADVVMLLGNNSSAASQLQKLDKQAQAAAGAIAGDEAKLANAISFLTSATTFVGAVATGNAVGAATQLGSMLKALNIS
jgi:hypothetical protein